MLGDSFLKGLQYNPGLCAHRTVDRIDLLDARHALRGQDEVRTLAIGAMDEAGETSVRHHALTAFMAQREDRGDLFGFTRPHDGASADRIAAPDPCRA